MVAICLDFKWLRNQISNPIKNLDHLHPTSFPPFKIQTSPDFRYPLYKVNVQKTVWGWLSILTCKRMVENNEKHSKIMKKIYFLSCVRDTQQGL